MASGIRENREILFGKFSPSVTSEKRRAVWNEITKQWVIWYGIRYFKNETCTPTAETYLLTGQLLLYSIIKGESISVEMILLANA